MTEEGRKAISNFKLAYIRTDGENRYFCRKKLLFTISTTSIILFTLPTECCRQIIMSSPNPVELSPMPSDRNIRSSETVRSRCKYYGVFFIVLAFLCLPWDDFIALVNQRIEGETVVTADQSTKTPLDGDANEEAKEETSTNNSSQTILPSKQPKFLIGVGGCVGSSATMRFTTEILEAHGIQIARWRQEVKSEYYRPEKNKMYRSIAEERNYANAKVDQDILFESIVHYNEMAQSENKSLLFKTKDNFHEVDKRFKQELNAVFSASYRENLLDVCACQVRDCFAKGSYGYPVFANGTKASNVCFDRRSKNITTYAVFTNLEKCLHDAERGVQRTSAVAKSLVSQQFKMPSTESLFALEYTDDKSVFEANITAWIDLMRPMLGDSLQEDIVRGVLEPFVNSRPAPGPHRDVIYNADEVEEQLRNLGPPFEQYYRSP